MEATEKQRTNFAAVRRKIIEPAVKELTEKDGWLIEWETIKAGRKVRGLRFNFIRNPQGSLPFDVPINQNKGLTRDEIQRNARPGETWEQAEKRIKSERKKPREEQMDWVENPPKKPVSKRK